MMKSSQTPGNAAPSAGWLGRLGERLGATRNSLGRGLGNLLIGRKTLDADLLDEIETLLILADLGVEATQRIIDDVTDRVSRKQLPDADAVFLAVRQHLLDILSPCTRPLTIPDTTQPYVIMVVGVNGVGKTTSIGKLAARLGREGKRVLLAAGDTFRAAAVEQLKAWGERINVSVVAQPTGSDSASVAHDAISAGLARNVDVIIIDTAGRQHTHADLMQELEKIHRVISKQLPGAPHEVLMVLDGGTGQNALSQLQHFNDAVGVTGLCITKLDGTARGGVLVALAQRFGIPIRYIGVGEQVDDLQVFDAEAFVSALFIAEPAKT